MHYYEYRKRHFDVLPLTHLKKLSKKITDQFVTIVKSLVSTLNHLFTELTG